MPDFRKNEIQATFWLEDFSADQFSWSAEKQSLFRACPRAYLLRYFIAQGGWDPLSAPIARKAFTEKYLKTFPGWLSELLSDSLAEGLATLRGVPKGRRKDVLIETLKYALSHRIFLAEDFLQHEGYRDDPKKLSLFEIYYKTGEFSSIRGITEECKRIFRHFFDRFPDTELLHEILAVEPLAWNVPPRFLSMPCERIPVILRPRIHAFDKGRLFALTLRISHHEKPEHSYLQEDEISADSLFAWYAGKKYGCRAECREFLLYHAELFESAATPKPAEERRILAEAEELLRKQPEPGDRQIHFPARKEDVKCRKCRFQGSCSYLDC